MKNVIVGFIEYLIYNLQEDQDSATRKDKADDANMTSDSPSGGGCVGNGSETLHYRNGDEPEPIDLTHLNVEAAMMCLASKVRVLCGKADSPTLCARTFRCETDASN